SLRYAATPALSTLSLHDALPICPDGLGDVLHQDIHGILAHADRLVGLVVAPQVEGHRPSVLPDGGEHLPPGVPALREAVEEQDRSEEHTSELQSRFDLVCRLLLE